MSRKLSLALMVLLAVCTSVCAFGQTTKIDPWSRINWPGAVGSGAPTAACPTSAVAVGSPYFDSTNNVSYVCSTSGWKTPPTGGGATLPSVAGLVYATSPLTSRKATAADVISLWASGSCSGFLASDGTCSTPGAQWGNITGALTSQSDLGTALNGKANINGGNTFTGKQTFQSTASKEAFGDVGQPNDPTTPAAAGGAYYNTSIKHYKFWDSSAWQTFFTANDYPSLSPRLIEGAFVDAKVDNTCATIAGNATISCVDAIFQPSDVGKVIGIPYAGIAAQTQTSSYVANGTTITFTGVFPTAYASGKNLLIGGCTTTPALNGVIIVANSGNTTTTTVAPYTATTISATDSCTLTVAPYIGQTLLTTIATYVDASHVTLTQAPYQTILGPRQVDLETTATSSNYTSQTASWTTGDIGKSVSVTGAGLPITGSAVDPQLIRIATITSPTVVGGTRYAINTLTAQTFTTTNLSLTSNTLSLNTSTQSINTNGGDYLYFSGCAVATFLNNNIAVTKSATATHVVATFVGTNIGTTTDTCNVLVVDQVIPGAKIVWGHDDTTPLQNAMNAGCAQGKTVLLDSGRYLTTTSLVPCNGLHMQGQGASGSIITPAITNINSTSVPSSGFYYNQSAQGAVAFLTDLQFLDFEVDMGYTRLNTSGFVTQAKCFFVRPTTRMIVRNVYMHDSPGTCFGPDFLVDGQVINNTFDHGGVQSVEYGNSSGGACIGIGTGMKSEEASLYQGNNVSDCGAHGLFLEAQSNTINSFGNRVVGNVCTWASNISADCFGDHSTQGTVWVGNVASYTSTCFRTNQGFDQGITGLDTVFEGNYASNCSAAAFSILMQTGGGAKVTGNMIGANSLVGITTQVYTGGTAGTVSITNNTMHDISTYCIELLYTSGTTYQQINIIGNEITNCGSTTTRQAGITVGANTTIAGLNVDRNVIWDTHTGSSQSTNYGLLVNSGATIGRLYLGNNDMSRNFTNTPVYNAGTITSLVQNQIPQVNLAPLALVAGASTVNLPIPYTSTTSYTCLGTDLTTPGTCSNHHKRFQSAIHYRRNWYGQRELELQR